MNAKDFLNQLQHDDIVAAIRAAELKTSGEIRVFVSRKNVPDAVTAAQAEFARLEMHRTRERNGVLIYVAPLSQTFAVIGDEGVHRLCGESFWTELAAEMTGYFKRGDFTDGLVHGVSKAGELLAQHFPPRPDDRNELPDAVERD